MPNKILHELYINCQDELESFLFTKIRCRETAADLSQEAFMRLCQTDGLEKIVNLKSYLFRTALNLHVDHFRRQTIRQKNSVEWTEDFPPEAEDQRSAETIALSEQELDRIIERLATLSPLCQRIFYLNRFEGMKQKEIAENLNISIRTVEDNIKRALLHCAQSIELSS